MCFLCYLKGELRVDQCRGILCVGSIIAHRDLIDCLVMSKPSDDCQSFYCPVEKLLPPTLFLPKSNTLICSMDVGLLEDQSKMMQKFFSQEQNKPISIVNPATIQMTV